MPADPGMPIFGLSEAKVKDQVKLGIRDIRDTYGHTLWAHTEPIPALSRLMLYRRGVGCG